VLGEERCVADAMSATRSAAAGSKRPMSACSRSRSAAPKKGGAAAPAYAAVPQGTLLKEMRFKPTEEEFRDPQQYITQIFAEASQAGVCMIEPPPSWRLQAGEAQWTGKEGSGGRFACKRQLLRRQQRPNGDPGFDMLPDELSLQDYHAKVDDIQEKLLAKMPGAAKDDAVSMESHFFGMLANDAGKGTDEPVIYGNDVEGSLLEQDAGLAEGSESIPLLPNSPLSCLGDGFPGITDPFMYFGCMFSFFSWHTEDNDLFSINYMLFGEPKVWYSVPADAAEQFEAVLKDRFPALHDKFPDLQFRKCAMLSPKELLDAGVRVHRHVQRPNDIAITFPKAYHGGFSHGFNCGESSNFATPEWLKFGSESAERYREAHIQLQQGRNKGLQRDTVLKIDELLIKLTIQKDSDDSLRTAAMAQLVPRLKRELTDRKRLAEVVVAQPDAEAEDEDDGEDQDSEEYDIERIAAISTCREQVQLLIKWQGYPEMTWEPTSEGPKVDAFRKNTWQDPHEGASINWKDTKQGWMPCTIATTGRRECTLQPKEGPVVKNIKLEKGDFGKLWFYRSDTADEDEASAEQAASGAEEMQQDAGASGGIKTVLLTEKGTQEKVMSSTRTVTFDWVDEPCTTCRHPCHFSFVVTAARDWKNKSNADAVKLKEQGERDGSEWDQQLESHVCCPSPHCLNQLHGTPSDWLLVCFQSDDELQNMLSTDLGSQHADCEELKPIQGVTELKPIRKATKAAAFIKTEQHLAILQKWWDARVQVDEAPANCDMCDTYVDATAKRGLAKQMGVDENSTAFDATKVDYWLWSQRKQFHKDHPGCKYVE